MKEILTPCILQTIIICCTIISLAMIAVSAFRVWKEQEKHDSGNYIFIASSIVFIVITIFSYAFYQSDTILSFISLASSLISIILAVVTIIYSFYTNSNSSNQVEKLNDAVDNVDKTVEKVDNAAKKVTDAANQYLESANNFDEKLQAILHVIDKVDVKTDKLSNMIASVNQQANSGTPKDLFDEETINTFVKYASGLGTMAIYGAISAKDYNLDLPLNTLGFERYESYGAGFLVALSCLNILNIQIEPNDKDNIWLLKTISYNPILKKAIMKKVKNAVSDENRFEHDSYVEVKNKIDDYIKKYKK